MLDLEVSDTVHYWTVFDLIDHLSTILFGTQHDSINFLMNIQQMNIKNIHSTESANPRNQYSLLQTRAYKQTTAIF